MAHSDRGTLGHHSCAVVDTLKRNAGRTTGEGVGGAVGEGVGATPRSPGEGVSDVSGGRVAPGVNVEAGARVAPLATVGSCVGEAIGSLEDSARPAVGAGVRAAGEGVAKYLPQLSERPFMASLWSK